MKYHHYCTSCTKHKAPASLQPPSLNLLTTLPKNARGKTIPFQYQTLTLLSPLPSKSFTRSYIKLTSTFRLLRLYQHVNHRVTSLGRPHKVYLNILFHPLTNLQMTNLRMTNPRYYLTTQTETIVSWVTSGFELYATFGPLESKPIAIKACNQLLRWIKVEENNLFILNSPVW